VEKWNDMLMLIKRRRDFVDSFSNRLEDEKSSSSHVVGMCARRRSQCVVVILSCIYISIQVLPFSNLGEEHKSRLSTRRNCRSSSSTLELS
jgi:hypothetical protein